MFGESVVYTDHKVIYRYIIIVFLSVLDKTNCDGKVLITVKPLL